MAGKHIFEVPPTNVGGITSCIGVCARGVDSQKVDDADFIQLLLYVLLFHMIHGLGQSYCILIILFNS